MSMSMFHLSVHMITLVMFCLLARSDPPLFLYRGLFHPLICVIALVMFKCRPVVTLLYCIIENCAIYLSA